jgi:hypothetical protein
MGVAGCRNPGGLCYSKALENDEGRCRMRGIFILGALLCFLNSQPALAIESCVVTDTPDGADTWIYITDDPREADERWYISPDLVPEVAFILHDIPSSDRHDKVFYLTDNPRRVNKWVYIARDPERADEWVYVQNAEVARFIQSLARRRN